MEGGDRISTFLGLSWILAKRKNLHSPSHPSTASRTAGDQCTSEKEKMWILSQVHYCVLPPPYNFPSGYIQTENVSIFDQPAKPAEERKWKGILRSSYLTFVHIGESLFWLVNNWINMRATFWARPNFDRSQGSDCVTQSGYQLKTDHNMAYIVAAHTWFQNAITLSHFIFCSICFSPRKLVSDLHFVSLEIQKQWKEISVEQGNWLVRSPDSGQALHINWGGA